MSDDSSPSDDDIEEDLFLGGHLRLRQFSRGHRAGTDAVLLAAAAAIAPGERFVDVGAGVGAAGLALAWRSGDSEGILLELDEATAALARQNVSANNMVGKVLVVAADLFDRLAMEKLTGTADLVLSNPPFFLAGRVRPSPDARRAIAHVARPEGQDGHGDWVRQMTGLLRPGGRLVMIHRPEALPQLIAGCGRRLGAMRLRSVHARAGQPAIRVLFGAIVGARGPLSILAPLILHDDDGRFSTEAEALHQGQAMAFWPKKNRP